MSLKIDRLQLEIGIKQDKARQKVLELEQSMREANKALKDIKKKFGGELRPNTKNRLRSSSSCSSSMTTSMPRLIWLTSRSASWVSGRRSRTLFLAT